MKNRSHKNVGLLVAAFSFIFVSLFSFATPVAAQDEVVNCDTLAKGESSEDSGTIHIAITSGLLDDVTYTYILDRLDNAENHGNSAGFVLKVDSLGSVLSQEKYQNLAQRLLDSPLETGLWVGQNRAQARGGVAELARVVDKVGVTPDSAIGDVGEPRLEENFGKPLNPALLEGSLNGDEAVTAGIAVGPRSNPSIKQFLITFDKYETITCLNATGSAEIRPTTVAETSSLPIGPQFFHSAASPEIAYLFLFLGLGLLLFEFYTAGVGIAGLLGAGLFVLSCYGLYLLPINTWALVLIFIALFLFAIDIQTNLPGFYSIIGLAAFTIGSVFLFDDMSMSKITLVIGLVSAALYVYTAMPSMVRTRFSTPTIGRSWMIGHDGKAQTAISPKGTVLVNDVPWLAITNRATPIREGDAIKVTGIDHLTLEVEPLEGAAKDYRDRS